MERTVYNHLPGDLDTLPGSTVIAIGILLAGREVFNESTLHKHRVWFLLRTYVVRCAKGFLDLCASRERGDRVDVVEQAAAPRRVDSLSLTESSGPPVPRIYVRAMH